MKLQTALKLAKRGIIAAGDIAKTLARAEGLEGHAKSVEVRIRGRNLMSSKK